jgi:multicomponent K+:H+ antiporter subunit G
LTEPATPLLDWLIAALLVAGATFALIGSIGLARFGDFYRRLHGPTKATTLGVGGVLLASALFFSRLTGSASLHELLVTAFLFVTAPVSAQLLVKAALRADPVAPPLPAATPSAGGASGGNPALAETSNPREESSRGDARR